MVDSRKKNRFSLQGLEEPVTKGKWLLSCITNCCFANKSPLPQAEGPLSINATESPKSLFLFAWYIYLPILLKIPSQKRFLIYFQVVQKQSHCLKHLPTVILVLGLVSPFQDSSGTLTFKYVFGEFSHLVFSLCCLWARNFKGESGIVSSSKEKAVTVAGISTSLLCLGFSLTNGCL